MHATWRKRGRGEGEKERAREKCRGARVHLSSARRSLSVSTPLSSLRFPFDLTLLLVYDINAKRGHAATAATAATTLPSWTTPRMLLARIREQDRWGCPGILSSIDLPRI